MSDFKTIKEVLANVIKELTELQVNLPKEDLKPTKAKEEVKSAVTLEEVRSVLVNLTRNGLTKQIKELLKKHGANKLSEIDPKDYSDLLKEAKELETNA